MKNVYPPQHTLASHQPSTYLIYYGLQDLKMLTQWFAAFRIAKQCCV